MSPDLPHMYWDCMSSIEVFSFPIGKSVGFTNRFLNRIDYCIHDKTELKEYQTLYSPR